MSAQSPFPLFLSQTFSPIKLLCSKPYLSFCFLETQPQQTLMSDGIYDNDLKVRKDHAGGLIKLLMETGGKGGHCVIVIARNRRRMQTIIYQVPTMCQQLYKCCYLVFVIAFQNRPCYPYFTDRISHNIYPHILDDIYYTTELPAFKDKRKVQICTQAIEVNMMSDTKNREKGHLSGLRIWSRFPEGINI